MKNLEETVIIWKKLGKARGALSQISFFLNSIPNTEGITAFINAALEETACDPPKDLDLDIYINKNLIRRN